HVIRIILSLMFNCFSLHLSGNLIENMRARYLMLVLILSLSSTGLLTAQPVPDYVPAGNLLGWWPFSGDLNDKSGAGKHGYGGVPTLANDKDGAPNNAYHFDNTYAVLPSLS